MELAVYVLLLLASIVGLTFVVERGIALRWRRVVPPAIEGAVKSCHQREDVPMLRRVCEANPSPLGRLLLLASEHLDWPKADNVDALQTQARHEITRLERGLAGAVRPGHLLRASRVRRQPRHLRGHRRQRLLHLHDRRHD